MRSLCIPIDKTHVLDTPEHHAAFVGAFNGAQHGCRFRYWTDDTTPRTKKPARFRYLARPITGFLTFRVQYSSHRLRANITIH